MLQTSQLYEVLEVFAAKLQQTSSTVLRSAIKLGAGEFASKVGASREIATGLIEKWYQERGVKIIHDLDESGRVLSADELAADKTLPFGAPAPKFD